MKIIFSDSFLTDASRKDINLRLSNYFLAQGLLTGENTLEEIIANDIFNSLTTKTSLKEIEGIWETKTNILRLYIHLTDDEYFTYADYRIGYNLACFYYRTSVDTEKIAFIIVSDNVIISSNQKITLDLNDDLGLCSGRNLINIVKIPGRECGFEFVTNNIDTTFLESCGNLTGKSIYFYIGVNQQPSLVFRKSYETYMVYGNYKEFETVDQYFSTTGEILTNSYTFKRVTGIEINSPSALWNTMYNINTILLGEDGGNIYITGTYDWIEYKVSGAVITEINRGTDNIRNLLSGSIITSGDRDIVSETNFIEKTLNIESIDPGISNISYSIEVKISALNLLYNGEVETVESNSIKIIQSKNQSKWGIDFNNKYIEESLPLLVIDGHENDYIEINFKTNNIFKFTHPLDSSKDVLSGSISFGSVYNNFTVYADYLEWSKWFDVECEVISEITGKLKIIAKQDNKTTTWYPVVGGESIIPKFSLVLGDTRIDNFFVVQKPITSNELALYEPDDKDEEGNYIFKKVNKIVVDRETPVTVYPTFPRKEGEMIWTLMDGDATKTSGFNEDEGLIRYMIDVNPKNGELNITDSIDTREGKSMVVSTTFKNWEIEDTYVGNLIICKGTEDYITEDDWRILICNDTYSVPCYLRGTKPFVEITSIDNNKEGIILSGGFQEFKYNIRSNCPVLLNYNNITNKGIFKVTLKYPEDPTLILEDGQTELIVPTYNYKEGIIMSGIFEWISLEDFDGFEHIGNITGTRVGYDEGSDGLISLKFYPTKKNNIVFFRENVLKNEPNINSYGIWLEEYAENSPLVLSLISKDRSLAASLSKNLLNTEEDRIVTFSKSKNFENNSILDQKVSYKKSEGDDYFSYLATSTELEYSVSVVENKNSDEEEKEEVEEHPEEDNDSNSFSNRYPRYPIKPYGFLNFETANSIGNGTSGYGKPCIKVPVFVKSEEPVLFLQDKDGISMDSINIPYNVYVDEDDINWETPIIDYTNLLRPVTINKTVFIEDGGTLDLNGFSLTINPEKQEKEDEDNNIPPIVNPENPAFPTPEVNPEEPEEEKEKEVKPIEGEDDTEKEKNIDDNDIPPIAPGGSIIPPTPSVDTYVENDLLFCIKVSGDVSIINGVIKTDLTEEELYGVIFARRNSKLTLQNVRIICKTKCIVVGRDAKVIIENGEYICEADNSTVFIYEEGGKVNIKGGKFSTQPWRDKYYTLNILDSLVTPDSKPADFFTITGGLFINFDPKSPNLEEGWEKESYIGEEYEVIQNGNDYRVKKIEDNSIPVDIDLTDFKEEPYKFYIRSNYKYKTEELINNSLSYKITNNSVGVSEILIYYTENSYIDDEGYYVYEFESKVIGELTKEYLTTIGEFDMYFEMQSLSDIILDGSDIPSGSTESWTSKSDKTSRAILNSLVPPATLKTFINWEPRDVMAGKPDYIIDDFSIIGSRESSPSIGDYREFTLVYPEEAFTVEIMECNQHADLLSSTSMNFYTDMIEVTRPVDENGNEITFFKVDEEENLLSKYNDLLTKLSKGVINYFTVVWTSISGATRHKQVFSKRVEIPQLGWDRIIINSFDNNSSYFAIPNGKLPTLYVPYDTRQINSCVITISISEILKEISKNPEATSYVVEGGAWVEDYKYDKENSVVISTVFNKNTESPKFYTSGMLENNGYSIQRISRYNESYDTPRTLTLYQYSTPFNGIIYYTYYNVVQDIHPEDDQIFNTLGRYESGCNLRYHSCGKCIDNGKFYESPYILIPEVDTTLDPSKFTLYFREETDEEGLGEKLDLTYIQLSKGEFEGSVKYQLLALIPKNNNKYIFDEFIKDNSTKSAFLELRSDEKDGHIIWVANIIQGTTTIFLENNQVGESDEEGNLGSIENPIVAPDYRYLTLDRESAFSLRSNTKDSDFSTRFKNRYTCVEVEPKLESVSKPAGRDVDIDWTMENPARIIYPEGVNNLVLYNNLENKFENATDVINGAYNLGVFPEQFSDYGPCLAFQCEANSAYYTKNVIFGVNFNIKTEYNSYSNFISSDLMKENNLTAWLLKPRMPGFNKLFNVIVDDYNIGTTVSEVDGIYTNIWNQIKIPYTGGNFCLHARELGITTEEGDYSDISFEMESNNWLSTVVILDTCGKFLVSSNPTYDQRVIDITITVDGIGSQIVRIIQDPNPLPQYSRVINYYIHGGSVSSMEYLDGGYNNIWYTCTIPKSASSNSFCIHARKYGTSTDYSTSLCSYSMNVDWIKIGTKYSTYQRFNISANNTGTTRMGYITITVNGVGSNVLRVIQNG